MESERVVTMDLSIKSQENVVYMVKQIIEKLQLVNASVIKAEDFNLDRYDDLYDLYELVTKKSNFSISEMEAIAGELGNLRENK